MIKSDNSLKLIFALLLFFYSINSNAEEKSISLVYTLDNPKFTYLLSLFSAKTGIQIDSIELDNNKLKSQLQLDDSETVIPDVMIVPADFIGLKKLNYNPVPKNWLNPYLREKDIKNASIKGQVYGIPIISGNHLVLYYNKSKVTEPIKNWQQLISDTKSALPKIAWSYSEMYWLIPFLTAFNALPFNPESNPAVQFDTEQMQQALTFYWSLNRQGLIDGKCAYECAINQFKLGHVDYLIDGFWSYTSLKSSLGNDLGVTALPKIGNKEMRSYYSVYLMAFPNHSLSKHKQADLKELADFFQSIETQEYLSENLFSLPTHSLVFNSVSRKANQNLKSVISQMERSIAMPNNPEMAIIWEVLFKGFNRYGSGVFDAQKTTEYMQHIATRSISNLN
ncbi:extracellular solute-binding protein [Catenovulum sp. 2E275]|uniref:sugar ABC transporter substrate-binding protein n=1 Tax=Catenovulum sp. 2E275 TaxID=2980497 RepID=UPI0021D21B23|nr:extracellular solute-binding protein [Catenovulum sp. 2E275]MCU4675900.1 extracellular solute-binding protein [Catenovulum sp. 2E275]